MKFWEDENWISIKKELPPFDVLINAKGSDFRGDFYLENPIARKQYKQIQKGKNRGWRWVDANGERVQDSDDIDAWKHLPTTKKE